MKLLGLAFVIFALTLALFLSQVLGSQDVPPGPGPQAVAERFFSRVRSDDWADAIEDSVCRSQTTPEKRGSCLEILEAMHDDLAGTTPTAIETSPSCIWRDSEGAHDGACVTFFVLRPDGNEVGFDVNLVFEGGRWVTAGYALDLPEEPSPGSSPAH
ncbi:MAG: hypothetical protein WD004_08665 [Actinomycetota bacterium]